MSRYSSHTFARLSLYVLLWIVAVILLGLTADRVHFTKSNLGGYEPIIVELLVSSILTIFWAPIALLVLAKDRFQDSFGNARIHHELIGVAILWLFFLVGAVDTTNQIVPGKNYCPSGKECGILVSILAFSWTAWSILSLLLVLALLNNAALTGSPTPNAATRDKPVATAAA